MKKQLLLLGTACGTIFLCGKLAFAQDSGTATPIQGISKSAGGSTGTPAAAMAKKIPLKSQYAASHISKVEIDQASPAATDDSILNTEPSINATSAGPLGVEQTITFRSFNSAQFSQTYDGLALNDVFNAGATNEASLKNNVLIIPQDFESVDIYRGINNPATNSYNSLAGTINYNPVEPADAAGGYVSGNAGSFDTLGYNFLLNSGKIDGFSNVLAFSRESSSGWLEHNKDQNTNVYDAFKQDIDPTGKIYGTLVYNQNNGEEAYDEPASLIQQYGNNYQAPLSEYREPLQDTDYMFILGATQTFDDFVTFDIKGFAGDDDFQRNAYSNPADQKTGFYIPNKDTEGTSTTYYGYYGQTVGVQPKVTVDLPFDNTLTLGGNYTLGHLHSREYFGNQDPVVQIPGYNDLWDEHDVRTLYSVYLQDEIDLLDDAIKITPGVKYLYANTKDTDDAGYDYPTGGSVSGTSHYISPTLGASYEFLPNTVLYAAYGQNVEFPTIDAYYDNIDGQNGQGEYENDVEPVHLEPEHVTDYEAGLRYSNAPLGFSGALGFYLENFSDTFITATDPSSDLSTTINGGSSQYKGLELQLAEDFGEQHLAQTDIGDFTGYLNYSLNNAIYTNKTPLTVSTVGSNNAAGSATVVDGDPIALVPEDEVHFGGTWSLAGWGAHADASYVTSQLIDQPSTGTTSNLREPAYFLLNLGLSKTIPLSNMGIAKSITFSFNVDNALNRVYDAYSYEETYTKYAPKALQGKSYASIQLAAPQAFYGSIKLTF